MSYLHPLYEVIISCTDRVSILFNTKLTDDIRELLKGRSRYSFNHEPTQEEIENLILELKGNIFETHVISVKVEKYFVNY